jgi:hypothetical protein
MTISSRSLDILWERTSDGKSARRVLLPSVKNAGAFVRSLAYAKLVSVQSVSAEFHGESVYFERRLVILRSETPSLRLTSLFLSTEAGGTTPAVCIRTVTWERDADYQLFERAPSKLAYVLSPSQLEGKVRFFGMNHDRASGLLRETERRVRQGVMIPLAPDSDSFTRFEGYFDQFSVGVSFARDAGHPLETMASRCESELAQLASSVETLPDDGCSVGHEPSVWERIASFAEAP